MNWSTRRMILSAALLTSVLDVAPVLHSQEAATDQIQEVTVTARRREETLESVPLAITALSPVYLATHETRDILDLDGRIPNLFVAQSAGIPSGANTYIRGVGQDDSTFTAEQGVGTYLDGVLLARSNSIAFDFLDPESIEVLRGPQGTLYGRNSTTGAIRLTTRRPDLNNVDALTEVTTGSLSRLDIRGSVSTPIDPGVLAIKLDFVHRYNNSFYDDIAAVNHINDIDNLDRSGGRLAALWQPSAALHVYATADYSRDNSTIITGTPVNEGPNGSRVFPLGNVFLTTHTLPNMQSTDNWGSMVEVGYDLGVADIKSISGYRGIWEPLNVDVFPLIPVLINQRFRDAEVTEDLTLTSKGSGPFTYTAGLYYFRETAQMNALNSFQNTHNYNLQVSDSYAVYGEVSYKFIPSLTLNAGGRYSYDKKTMTTSAFAISNGSTLFDDLMIPVSFNRFTPKGSIDWQFTPDVLLYGSIADGYKPGGFSSGRPSDIGSAESIYQPETVTSYEVGLKGDFLDRRLRVNADYFYSVYSNLAESYTTTIAGVTRYNILTANATIRGPEIEVTAIPVHGLEVGLNVAGLRSHYTKIPVDPTTGAYLDGLTPTSVLKDAPDYTVNLDVTYTHPMGEGGKLITNVNSNWQGWTYRSANDYPVLESPPRNVIDAQVAYDAREHWRLAAGGKNITNTVYWNSSNNPFTLYFAPKATWYLTLDYKY